MTFMWNLKKPKINKASDTENNLMGARRERSGALGEKSGGLGE